MGEPLLHATPYVNARDLTSSVVPDGPGGIELQLDLVDHVGIGTATDWRVARFTMGPMSVADFHERFLDLISALGARRNCMVDRMRSPTQSRSREIGCSGLTTRKP
jgi:uncharacterized protein DUF5996